MLVIEKGFLDQLQFEQTERIKLSEPKRDIEEKFSKMRNKSEQFFKSVYRESIYSWMERFDRRHRLDNSRKRRPGPGPVPRQK